MLTQPEIVMNKAKKRILELVELSAKAKAVRIKWIREHKFGDVSPLARVEPSL